MIVNSIVCSCGNHSAQHPPSQCIPSPCALRCSVPVVDYANPAVSNLITQSAVVRGLARCRGFDWFDVIAEKTLAQLALPIMAPEEVSWREQGAACSAGSIHFLCLYLWD